MQYFIWASSNLPKFRKTNDRVSRKRLDQRRNRQTLLYRTLSATTRGPKIFITNVKKKIKTLTPFICAKTNAVVIF